MRLKLFLFISLPFLVTSQDCWSELDEKYNNLSPIEFIHYSDSLSHKCKSGFGAYYRSLTYMKLDSVSHSVAECESLLQIYNTVKHSYVPRSLIAQLCFLQMEECRRVKDKVEFEKWKDYAHGLRDKKCATGVDKTILRNYEIMLDRFVLNEDEKEQRIYQKKIKRFSYRYWWGGQNFYKY